MLVSERRVFRTRLLSLVALAVLGSGLVLPAWADSDDEGSCKVAALPADIKSSLERNFAVWKVQEAADLSPRARQRWESEKPLSCPGLAAGHFQNNRDTVYALLLVPIKHDTIAYRLILFTQQSGQKFYGFKVVAQAFEDADSVFVRSVPTEKFAEHGKAPDSVLFVTASDKTQQASVFVWANDGYERQTVNY